MIDFRKPYDYDHYITLEAFTINDLNIKCNKLSAMGYKHTGPMVIGGGGYTYFQQWMKEYKIEEKRPIRK